MVFDPIAYINEPRWLTSRLGLERITELLHRLGNPQDRVRIIHVAGTNGKGSVSAFLAHILQRADYVTGFFSSPYIMEFSDRIRVNGNNISPQDLMAVTLLVKQEAEAMEDHPTEFELMTAVAFLHFERCACDVAVVEVGLGGRLDSTNVIQSPELCIITAIGIDHTEMLGTRLGAIAAEKAGIIKDGSTVISWPQESEAMDVVVSRVRECDAKLAVPDFDCLHIGPVTYSMQRGYFVRKFDYRGYTDLEVQLIGSYQPYNCAVVLEAVSQLRSAGWIIGEDALRQGLADTTWPGRFEVINKDPIFIIDGAHNVQGAQALVASLDEAFYERPVVFIMGVLADKEYKNMLKIALPRGCALVTFTPPNPRGLLGRDLAQAASEYMLDAEGEKISYRVPPIHVDSVAEAVEAAYSLARENDIICAWGSLYSVSALKEAHRALLS